MSPGIVGGLLGLLLAAGAIIAVRAAPPMRPVRLAQRVAPYLGDTPRPSRLLADRAPGAPLLVARRLVGPALNDLVRGLDRALGGTVSVRRRLSGLGSPLTVEDLRVEQIVWGAAGLLGAGGATAAAGWVRGGVDPVFVAGVALAGAVAGVLARDWQLTRQLQRREAAMLAEFPVFADLLALAVVAGEAPQDALLRVCRLTRGELARDIEGALSRSWSGTPLAAALGTLAARTTLEPFARFLQGIVVGLERGTPLAAVLRAQAVDVREISKRSLLEAGGRKEISMMLPVVFLILPVTVLFALYPGLLTLTSLAH